MIARHTLTYVGSRAVAAALNMVALAVFTRLAPVEHYGTYLLVLSWALVLYGATCQWPKFAFFALYDDARAPAQIGTVVRLLVLIVLAIALAAALAVAVGLVEGRLAGAVVAAVVGMAVFEGAVEIARTRLAAGAVAAAVVARGVLMLGLGSLALSLSGDPLSLVASFALANALGALPAARSVWPAVARGHGSRAEARRLIAYGWPLILSFGLAALAQTIDRIIVGRVVGPEELGAYGAIADFLRQSFVVFGESIALSMMSIAKRDARERGMAAAQPVLRDAIRTLTLVGAFGAVFFLTFDDLVVAVLLGPAYRDAAMDLAPILIVASVCLMIRSYYFGQVIYFAGASALDAVASLILLCAVGGLSLLLVPGLGAKGAAIAFAAGQILACAVFMLGARGRMPVPGADLVLIALYALAAGGAVSAVDLLPGLSPSVAIGLKLALLGFGAAGTAWRFNILRIGEGLGRPRRTAG